MERERKPSPPGLRAVAETVARIADPLLGGRGFAGSAIPRLWPSIVGAELAARTLPEKLVRVRGAAGTLHVRVASGALAVELQHLEPLIVEKVNACLGFRAVERLRLTHGPLPSPSAAARPASPPPLPPEQVAALEAAVAGVGDARLRSALQALGSRLQRR